MTSYCLLINQIFRVISNKYLQINIINTAQPDGQFPKAPSLHSWWKPQRRGDDSTATTRRPLHIQSDHYMSFEYFTTTLNHWYLVKYDCEGGDWDGFCPVSRFFQLWFLINLFMLSLFLSAKVCHSFETTKFSALSIVKNIHFFILQKPPLLLHNKGPHF